MDQGWIKVHRSLWDKPIWTGATSDQKVILLTLLKMATYKERQWEWKGKQYSLQPGQLITSLPSLVLQCGKGVTVQKIRTALKRFERYGFLTDESTNQNRLITIVSWDVYQQNDSFETAVSTGSQQLENRHVTSNKKVKNEKNVKTNYPPVVFDESSEYYQLALALHDNIRRNHPDKREPDLEKWINDMRFIVENDHRTIEQIHHLLKWSQQHHFWQTVILSPTALRRNWDQMMAQVKQEHERRKGQVYHLPKRQVNEFVLDLTKGEALF
ncbi:hypothetical protein MHZ92_09455 [Sporosarcina sp. ACRSL]|uniref:hypothetical protein n=1 Tax=Sporosarcina sp. ACRSL TaxID=2918215 RepID=UPI001EF6AC76|nr:hypothetical protein [Sporosarcina sp. ACRSL]MCG7344360.1 hypothetical protein [Sporosarcina sp. ACRSL]